MPGLFSDANSIRVIDMDGQVDYFVSAFSTQIADRLFLELSENIHWQKDRLTVFGKEYVMERQVAWYADQPFQYTYSKSTKIALPWSVSLIEIKNSIEQLTGFSFNACLLNLYPTGSDGMGWHSDDEDSLVKHAPIASVSFGAARNFSFKHKHSGKKQSIFLEHGSLLTMTGELQSHWWHSLPKSKRIFSTRINLTFRTMK